MNNNKIINYQIKIKIKKKKLTHYPKKINFNQKNKVSQRIN